MRHSNRDSILDAAIRVTNRDGIRAVTFDSVAAEAGVTRGGMIYHFNSRDALIQAINEQLAAHWEAVLVHHAGKPFEQTTSAERHRAYILASTHGATRAELLFLLEFAHDPALSAPWDRIIDAWAAPEPTDPDDAQAMANFIVRLASDGLWAHDYIANRRMVPPLKRRVSAALANMLDTPGMAVAPSTVKKKRTHPSTN